MTRRGKIFAVSRSTLKISAGTFQTLMNFKRKEDDGGIGKIFVGSGGLFGRYSIVIGDVRAECYKVWFVVRSCLQVLLPVFLEVGRLPKSVVEPRLEKLYFRVRERSFSTPKTFYEQSFSTSGSSA